MVRKEEGQESCFLLTHYGMQNIAINTKTDSDQLGVGVSKKVLVTCTSANRWNGLLDTASGQWFLSGWLPFLHVSR